jgi:hypothetical protein
MNMSNGKTVAVSTKISNHLYKLKDFSITHLPEMNTGHPGPKTALSYVFATNATGTWDMWHQRYGHLGLSSLQTLLDQCLITGLDLDPASSKQDCEACTLAKQHAAPFKVGKIKTATKPGELTHTGKYLVQSIHGNQYFHSFLDDSMRAQCYTS